MAVEAGGQGRDMIPAGMVLSSNSHLSSYLSVVAVEATQSNSDLDLPCSFAHEASREEKRSMTDLLKPFITAVPRATDSHLSLKSSLLVIELKPPAGLDGWIQA